MTEFKTGQLTAVLLTDVEGSSRLWEAYPVEMRQALSFYDHMLRQLVEESGGSVARGRGEGESVVATFSRVTDAVLAGLAIQKAALKADWPTPTPFRIRIALHIGEPEAGDGEHFGPTVNRAGRLRAIGHGGQVLLSDAIASLVRGALPSGVTLRDLGTHRLQDLTEPLEVFQLVHPDLPDAFPGLRSLNAVPNNLPQQLTRFIGRAHELEEIKRLIGESRLLTLTGPGGTGKTRIAIQAAAELLYRFSDGVFIVELDSVTDPDMVPQTVASVLGVKEKPGEALAVTLSSAIQDKEMLIILDNCEHVVSACANLAAGLLRYTGQVRIVATSREVLSAAGEMTWQVPPLSTPIARRITSAEALSTYESVQLFIERAVAVKPDFQVTNKNAPAVAEICHRLDGIPLAIELAAARVSVLSPEDIARRLTDRFKLLAGRSRTVLPRQQTLRALIDWSFDLLTEEERVLWRRLSVFAGGFTLEASESIVADDRLDVLDVFDGVTRLVEKSILITVIGAEQTRYRMLETIREYGLDKLEEAGEMAESRRRHRDYYVSYVCEIIPMKPRMDDAEQAKMIALTRADEENVNAALEACLSDPDSDTGIRMAGRLGHYWFQVGDIRLGCKRLDAILALPGSSVPTAARVYALNWAGFLSSCEWDLAKAVTLLEQSVELARSVGDRTLLAQALFYLAQAIADQTDFERQAALLEEVINLGDAAGQYSTSAISILASVKIRQGDFDAAETHLERCLRLFKGQENTYNYAWNMMVYGDLKIHQGETEAACDYAARAVEGIRKNGNPANLSDFLSLYGIGLCLTGDYASAASAIQEALIIVRDFNLSATGTIDQAGDVLTYLGDHLSAAKLFGNAVGLPEDPDPFWREYRETVRATLKRALGESEYEAAKKEGERMSQEEAIHFALERLAPHTVSKVEAAPSIMVDSEPYQSTDADSVGHEEARSAESPRGAASTAKSPSPPVPAVDTPHNLALNAMRDMNRVSLRECTVIGSYRRYDERARNSLRDWQYRISAPLREKTVTHDNFLIWAAPGSGKSFLIQETARSLDDKVSYFELNLARLGREDWVQALREVKECRTPVLCLLDEIDARADEMWPYEECFSMLDLNLGTDRSAVFVLIGSSTTGLESMANNMLKRSKAKDMLDRVPMDRRFQIAAPVLEDKAVILTSQVLDAAAHRGQTIDEIEKLALYYALTDESLQTPRQLRDLAVAAVQRLPQGERRLKYDDLFYRGDKRNKAFWMAHAEAADELSNVYVRVE